MRYNRHLILKDLNLNENTLDQSIIIIGCGGTGSHFAYLAASLGIKNIKIIDRDIIDLSNLNRQLLFFESDIGHSKSQVLANRLRGINSQINIESKSKHIDQFNIEQEIKINNKNSKNTIVVDCSDNLEIRHLLNEYCVKNKLKLISSAAIKTQGYVYTYNPENENSACLDCFLENKQSNTSCGIDGILNGALSMCASIMITELIKLITNEHKSQLIKFDSFQYTINKINVKKAKECRVCQKHNYAHLNSNESNTTKFCSGHYQKYISAKDMSQKIQELKGKISKVHEIKDIEVGFKFENIIVFNDGRVMIKAESPEEAEKLFNTYL